MRVRAAKNRKKTGFFFRRAGPPAARNRRPEARRKPAGNPPGSRRPPNRAHRRPETRRRQPGKPSRRKPAAHPPGTPARRSPATLRRFALQKSCAWGGGGQIPGCTWRRPRGRKKKISDQFREGGLRRNKADLKGCAFVLDTIEIGRKYGRFTVLGEAPKDRHGIKRYLCRCECGNEAAYPAYVILNKPDRYCRKCVPHTGGIPEPDLTGQTINCWEVLEKVERVNGLTSFRCRCTKCGAESIHSTGAIRLSNGKRCKDCARNYHFSVRDGVATGHLFNGSEFIIDAEDVEEVVQLTWRIDKDGYLSHYDRTQKTVILLHRLIARVDDPKVMVDHINRNRSDCRKSNLRVISPFGNSCNHSPFQTNKTGYTGVYFSKCSGRYEVKVGYNHRRILLGSTKDENQLIALAQMYNIGASFFFGEYAGALNDVPDPPDELVKRIITKCQKYMKAPAIAGASAA